MRLPKIHIHPLNQLRSSLLVLHIHLPSLETLAVMKAGQVDPILLDPCIFKWFLLFPFAWYTPLRWQTNRFMTVPFDAIWSAWLFTYLHKVFSSSSSFHLKKSRKETSFLSTILFWGHCMSSQQPASRPSFRHLKFHIYVTFTLQVKFFWPSYQEHEESLFWTILGQKD